MTSAPSATTGLHPASQDQSPAWLSRRSLYVLAVFWSALLVFEVEPMVARMLLPVLGGAPAVWNTAMAFFQIALLAGYGYAHGLQTMKDVRLQMGVHLVVLGLAALSLPLRLSGLIGAPDPLQSPVGWTLLELSLSVGAPFAVLSATAPLLQSWFARFPEPGQSTEGASPYSLYAASNTGSLLALISYPVVIEPLLRLSQQRLIWSLGYGVFAGLVAILLVLNLKRTPQSVRETAHTAPTARLGLGQMALWVALAAAPSSLMLGVTSQLTTDVASAPFLWVIPLALYLITFILAFADKRVFSQEIVLTLQGAAAAACAFIIPFVGAGIAAQLGVHLSCFFLTALLCHQALADRRPAPEHLTLFYLCLSLGGVVGGSFNALLAPVIFHSVVEYPLVLVLACLARPWGGTSFILALRAPLKTLGLFAVVIAACVSAIVLSKGLHGADGLTKALFAAAIVGAFLIRDRALYFASALALIAFSATLVGERANIISIDRSFFGVVKISESHDPLAGQIRQMAHGTTLHGAQSLAPGQECRPLTYYAPGTGIGETVRLVQAARPRIVWSTVGLGAGALSAYVRPGDQLTYYEIDPLVLHYASDPRYFTYTSHCAGAPVHFQIGDARLTLARLAPASQDLMIIDAFSSDTVPAHLLTVEAVKMYLSKLKPDGVLLFHLSNRHLELRDPVLAAVRAAGGVGLAQKRLQTGISAIASSSTIIVVAGHSPESLAPMTRAGDYDHRDPGKVKAWTDDYTNLIGAMLAHTAD